MSKQYDLEERSLKFARNVRMLVRDVPRTVASIEDCKQLVRSSGSIAANYIEANESLSKNDFIFRMKICRKEAKESHLWLKLLDLEKTTVLGKKRESLVREAWELTRIFGAITHRCKP